MNTTGSPAKVASSSWRDGPSPTNASRVPGTCSMMPLMAPRFFSAHSWGNGRGGCGEGGGVEQVPLMILLCTQWGQRQGWMR